MPAFSAPHTAASTLNPENFKATIVLLELTGLACRSRECENGRLRRMGRKLTKAAVIHKDQVTSSSVASSPPPPATVVVWLQRDDSEGRTTSTPTCLSSYPVTEESFEDEGKGVSWRCMWPYETSMIGFDVSSEQERTVAIGVGLTIPGVNGIQPLGVATVNIPKNEESEWNLSVSVDPMKKKFRLFGLFNKPKDCEHTISPSTVINMKLQVTRKASSLRIYDVPVEKESSERSYDDEASHFISANTDATSALSEESTPELFSVNSSYDGSKSGPISVEESKITNSFKKDHHFTAKDRDINTSKAAETQGLKDSPPPASAATDHFAKPTLKCKYFSDKEGEKGSMRKSAKTAETVDSITATSKNLNEPAFSDPFDSTSFMTDNSQRYSLVDPFGQITQIDDVVLFPAIDSDGSLQPSCDVPSMETTVPQVKPGVIQMDSRDIKQPVQQQGQAHMSVVGIDKTSLADLVFTDNKSQNSNVLADDAGHGVKPSCEMPLMEIVVPQGKANVIWEDNVSMDGQDIQQPDLQNGQVQMQDIVRDESDSVDLLFIRQNPQNSDVSTCSIATEIRSGGQQPQKKIMKIMHGILKNKKENKNKKATTIATETEEETDGLNNKNNGYCDESLPRIILKQVSSSSLNSLINDFVEGEKKKAERLEQEEDRFELILAVVDDEIEQDSLPRVTRGTLDEDLLTLASLDGTEVPLSDYGMLKRWGPLFEDVGEGISDILLCGIFSEESYDGDESTVYSDNSFVNNSNPSGECFGFRQEEVKDLLVSLQMDGQVGELQNAIACPVNTFSDTERDEEARFVGSSACISTDYDLELHASSLRLSHVLSHVV